MKRLALFSLCLFLASLAGPLTASSFFSRADRVEQFETRDNFMFQTSRNRSDFFASRAQEQSENAAAFAGLQAPRTTPLRDSRPLEPVGTELPRTYFHGSYETSTCWLDRSIQVCANYYENYNQRTNENNL